MYYHSYMDEGTGLVAVQYIELISIASIFIPHDSWSAERTELIMEASPYKNFEDYSEL